MTTWGPSTIRQLFPRTLIPMVALCLLGVPRSGAAQTITLTPGPVVTGVGQSQEFIALVTGTTQKGVTFRVCDANGKNCVTGGNSTIGTIAEVGRDAKNNRIARYTAPATVPSVPACEAVTDGCRLKIKAKLKNFTVPAAKAAITISPTATNPVPLVAAISPTSAAAEGSAFTLSVEGSEFISSSVVRWRGSDRNTTFTSATRLSAQIRAADLEIPEPADVTVFNPAPQGGESNAVEFTIDPGPARLVERSSQSSGGVQGNAVSTSAALSASGRFLAFDSIATNLVANDTNGVADIFLRDTCLGEGASCTPATTRVSVATDGTPGNASSVNAALSDDGRFVAFVSLSTTLVSNDTNGARDVFVRDTCLGAGTSCTPSTSRVSLADDGSQANAGPDTAPSISADGRFVAFDSFASNLVASDTNGVTDIFVRDTCRRAGGSCTASTTRVSVASNGTAGNAASGNPSLSADARFVAFSSLATNLVSSDTNGLVDIFVRDTCRGAASGCTPSTTRITVASDGTQPNGASERPAISEDGRFVAFMSLASNLISNDTNGLADIFVRDTCRGAGSGCTPSTRRVSVATDGTQTNGASDTPAISGNGRWVVFASDASNLVASDTNGVRDIFLRDTCAGATGCTPTTLRVSVSRSGAQANGGASLDPGLSRNGHFVGYTSLSADLVSGDTNGVNDIFLGRTGR